MDPFLLDPSPPIPPPPLIPVEAQAIVSSVVTNPTTVSAAPTFNHPPYSDMICEAIGALKEINGSSKRAIAKYIESAYKDLPPTHSALLTHHLKRLKNNGFLVMVKKSYKLAASNTRSDAPIPDSAPSNPPNAIASTGAKRGRGRPPKPRPLPMPTSLPTVDPNPQQPLPISDRPKKSPGRPRKNGPVSQLVVARRGRGRPPKSGPKKSPGRPRKLKTVRSVVGANAVKRGRGRPPKALNQLPPQAALPIQPQPIAQPVAVPYADAAAITVAPNLSRPRGRPKGAVGAGGARAPGGGARVPGKQRGRPPKMGRVTAQAIKPKRTTGKPVGRPRKTTHEADSKALSVAYGDLKRKLEFCQSKVKQAVGVLKPQLSSESNIAAISAIQELEGLAAMDLSIPLKEGAQPPLPPQLLPPPSTQPLVSQNEGQVYY